MTIKCLLCGKPVKDKIIPLEQKSIDKWDGDWGIEVIWRGYIAIICLECYSWMRS